MSDLQAFFLVHSQDTFDCGHVCVHARRMPALDGYAKRQITFNSNVFLMSAANICREFWLASVCARGNYSMGVDGEKPSNYATKTL